MDGGPIGRGGGRDLREFIPGRNKTVRFDENPLSGAIAVFLIFSLFGCVAFWAGLKLSVECLTKHELRPLAPAGAMLFFGALFIAPGVLMFYAALESMRCVTLDALSARLNVPEETLRQVALEKGITVPRYRVMGRDLYRPRDFDSLNLLRASTAPVKPDELLRSGAVTPMSSDLLLRTSASPTAPAETGSPTSDLSSEGGNV